MFLQQLRPIRIGLSIAGHKSGAGIDAPSDVRYAQARMLLGRVIGTVVATQKNERYRGARILLVQPIQPDGSDHGLPLLALDAVDAGVGDTVLLVQEGWAASTAATGEPGAAIDATIIGVVDRIELLEERS